MSRLLNDLDGFLKKGFIDKDICRQGNIITEAFSK